MRERIDNLPDWDKVYRPGVEIRAHPVAKWEHALGLSQHLRAEYNGFREALGEETVVELSEDRRSASFRVRLSEEPPIDRWTLLLGDTLNNYRSALDGLAWELAHLDGRTLPSKQERALYFPLAATEADWERLKSTTLASMPEVVLSRLHTVQPYRFEPVDRGIGILLSKMSNLDKHRSALVLELRVVDRTTFEMEAVFVPGSEATSGGGYEFTAPARQVRDGDEVFRFDEARPMESARVKKLPMILGVDIDGTVYNIFELLDLIERQVAGTFINACVGVAPPDWAYFMLRGGPRPTSPWFPNVGTFSPEMRRLANPGG